MKDFAWSGEPRTLRDILKRTNPHYGEGPEWEDNCQKCVVAEELQFRGYDVTAKPYDKNDRVKSSMAAWKFDAENCENDAGFKAIRNKTVLLDEVESEFAKWGDSARAVLRIEGKDKIAHAMFVTKSGGRLVYSDPQFGIVVNMRKRLEKCTDRENAFWVMRVDNRELTEAVKDAVENIGGEK